MQGLGLIVPHRLFPLLTPQELELLVCGEPVDLARLERACCYENCRATDTIIRHFWSVVNDEFNDAERQAAPTPHTPCSLDEYISSPS